MPSSTSSHQKMAKCCIFLHGLGLSSVIWDPLIKILDGDLFALDLQGHGNATKGSYDFHSMWINIKNQIPENCWKNSILVLHSMSAALLPEIAKCSERPSELILIEGNLIDEDLEWSKKICSIPPEKFFIWFERLKRNAPLVLRTQLKTSHQYSDIEAWSKGFSMVDSIALQEIAKNLIATNKSDAIFLAIQKLGIPTYYLRGEYSPNWTKGINLLRSIGVPTLNIPNSGHYPMLDNPAEIRSIINNLRNSNAIFSP